MSLVDLGRATPGASPQKCEDEMQNLQRGLDHMVSWLLLGLCVAAGPCAEATRPASGVGFRDIDTLGRGGRRALARILIRPPPAVAPTTVVTTWAATQSSAPPSRRTRRCVQQHVQLWHSFPAWAFTAVSVCAPLNRATMFSGCTAPAALGAPVGGVKILLPTLAQMVAE